LAERSSGRFVAIAIGGVLILLVVATTVLVCGAGTLFTVGGGDSCPHEATLGGLKVDRVQVDPDGVEIHLVGQRLPGLPDDYLLAMRHGSDAAEPAVEVRVEPAVDGLVIRAEPLPPDTTRSHELTLNFPCRQGALACSHGGTDDSHSLTLKLTLFANAAGQVSVASLDTSSGYDSGHH
jgi:hypothetical protein